MTTLAKKHYVSLSTGSRAVNRDLGMTSHVQRRCHLTAKAKAIRTEKCPKLVSFIKYQGAKKALVFVDEKKFTGRWSESQKILVLLYMNLLTSHLCFRLRILPLIVLSVTANDGSVMNPLFIEAGLKIGTKEYLDLMKTSPLLWMEQNFGLNNAVNHHQVIPQKHHKPFLVRSIIFFFRASIWPSNSPALNLLNYILWGVLQARTNASQHSSIKSLKIACRMHYAQVKRVEIVAAVKQYHARGVMVIVIGNGHGDTSSNPGRGWLHFI